MRIHSDILDTLDFVQARREATELSGALVNVESLTYHGSRKRNRGIELQLSSDGTLSKRRRNPGTSLDRSALGTYVATWDQWGYVIARLFDADPDAIVGPYNGRDDFHNRTAWKFDRDQEWSVVDGAGTFLAGPFTTEQAAETRAEELQAAGQDDAQTAAVSNFREYEPTV